MKLDSWWGRALIPLGLGLFQLWAKTLRFRMPDRETLAAVRAQPVIFGIWHNRLLLLPPVFDFCFPNRQSVGLISMSRDGDIVSILIERSGYGTIRGSSSRKGIIALRRLVETLAAGANVLITPDGPRGPVYEVSPGIVFVAQKSGAPIVPVHMEYSNAWRLKSWDGFFIPKPFSSVRVCIGELISVAPKADAEEFERERLRIKNAMMTLVQEQ